MKTLRRRPWLAVLALVVIVGALLVGSFGIYLAGTAGRLPWQEDPTRIPITPFAGIPGFGGSFANPTDPAATPSPEADATLDDVSSSQGADAAEVVRVAGGSWVTLGAGGAAWRR
ncbi:MAG: hypothetical protein M3121_04770 [Chloroflexota bacterium]|nr:hypothetical protein [Chloroflexota bacterium]